MSNSSLGDQLGRAGQGRGENASSAQRALNGEPSAVDVFHDVLGQRQTEARAGGHVSIFLHAIKPLEHFKPFFKPDARVFDFKQRFVVAGAGASVTRPPSGVYLIAFESKLIATCIIKSRSASTAKYIGLSSAVSSIRLAAPSGERCRALRRAVRSAKYGPWRRSSCRLRSRPYSAGCRSTAAAGSACVLMTPRNSSRVCWSSTSPSDNSST